MLRCTFFLVSSLGAQFDRFSVFFSFYFAFLFLLFCLILLVIVPFCLFSLLYLLLYVVRLGSVTILDSASCKLKDSKEKYPSFKRVGREIYSKSIRDR